MKNILKATLQYAEYFLVLAVLFYWFFTSTLLNPFAIGLLLILVLQIIFKNEVSGILIPGIFILLCLYMLLALRSELNEFPVFDTDAQIMLITGLLYFLSTMLFAIFMFLHYVRKMIL